MNGGGAGGGGQKARWAQGTGNFTDLEKEAGAEAKEGFKLGSGLFHIIQCIDNRLGGWAGKAGSLSKVVMVVQVGATWTSVTVKVDRGQRTGRRQSCRANWASAKGPRKQRAHKQEETALLLMSRKFCGLDRRSNQPQHSLKPKPHPEQSPNSLHSMTAG